MKTTQQDTQKFILKLFPEIMVKGASAKRKMISQLYNNLQKILIPLSLEIQFKKFFDKIEVVTPLDVVDEVRIKLLDTPGVEIILEALQFDNMDTLEKIKEKVNEIMRDKIEGKTFVVRAKRTGEQEFSSRDLEQTIGGYMLAKNSTNGVDLHTPEVKVSIELLHKQLNIITKRHQGMGGFPLGTQGDILSLMSGGFDSTVASYLTMKRGIKTHFLFFNLGGTAHEIGVKQVASYLWEKFGSSHKVTFTTINFDDVVTEIFRSTSEPYMGVTLKRLMLQAAQHIANSMKIDALLTGESVAQVSSQTLRNLSLIDQVTNKLVLRPLATMSKPDIINIATQIGTKRFAEAMPEYCGVISKSPVTHGSYERMEKESKQFEYTVLDKAVQNAITINIDQILEDIQTNVGEIEVISDLSNKEYTVIDIRQTDEMINLPCETLKIPFYNLKLEFPKLPQDKEYLFYCDKGILSQLHAQYLKDSQNYTNIKVYRPL
jgi:thiamine biosynthesis protein ThiI